MFRRLLLILTLGSVAALVMVNLDPVTTKLHRLVVSLYIMVAPSYSSSDSV